MDNTGNIMNLLMNNIQQIIRDDKKNISYLIYYSMIEAILLMVSPLTSAFIINSVLAHATVSIGVLGFIVIVVFMIIALIQVLKAYMVEKFEQRIFVKNAIDISQLAVNDKAQRDDQTVDKYMNYFFDVIAIQKLFPSLLLNGTGLVVKLVVSLILLLVFNFSFFMLGIFFIVFFLFFVLLLGRKGAGFAVERSDAKHEAIYYLQDIPSEKKSRDEILKELDTRLIRFVETRQRMFSVVVKQLGLTYFMEGLVLSSFFIMGGYLVFEGDVPIGEFVAAEIIIIYVIYALKDFMKQIDYMYEAIEGFYKLNKLSSVLENK